MAVWKVVTLVNLALVVGLGSGYLWGGRQTARLRGELAAAARTTAATGVEREFQGQGVVRALLPELNVIVLTHNDIVGYMPPMTMGFRAASPPLFDGVEVGDTVHFVLRGTLPNLVLTGIQKLP